MPSPFLRATLPLKVIYFVSHSTQAAVLGLFCLFLGCSWLVLGLFRLFLACSWVVQVVLGSFRGVPSFSNDDSKSGMKRLVEQPKRVIVRRKKVS